MSTFDVYKRVLFSQGQEITAQDLSDCSSFVNASTNEQVMSSFIPNITGGSSDPEFYDNSGWPNFPPIYAYVLKPGGARPKAFGAKIFMSAGTIFQKVADSVDGSTSRFLPFTFDGSDPGLTIANGDPSNPRVDILQMKLEEVSDDVQSRVFMQDGTKATLNLATFTTHVNTIIRARVPGISGNNISISFVPDGGGSGTISVSGNIVTYHFEPGTSTVLHFETLISDPLIQSLIEINTIGTPTNVFSNPADTAIPHHLSSGVDGVIVTQTMAMKTRIKCTLAIKQGTPAVSPTYPRADTGFVVVAGIVVGTAYAGATLIDQDSGGATAVIHDQRMPMGISVHHVLAKDILYDTNHWDPGPTGDVITGLTNASSGFITAVPRIRTAGRIIAVATFSNTITTGAIPAALSAVTLSKYSLTDSGGGSLAVFLTPLANVAVLGGTVGYKIRYANERTNTINDFPGAGPTVLRNADAIGAPIWTSGRRCPKDFSTINQITDGFETISLAILPANVGGFNGAGTIIGPITFWIADGV